MTTVRRFGPTALIAVMTAVAAALAVPVLRDGGSTMLEPRIPVLVLVVTWIAFEPVVVHLRFGSTPDDGQEVVLTEMPLALGLLFAAPADLLLAGILARPLVGLLQGRQGALKLAFNTSNRALEAALALTLYRAFQPDEPISLHGWAVLACVVATTGLVSSLMVSLVVTLVTGELPILATVRSMVWSVLAPMLAATLALVVALAVSTLAWMVVPVLIIGVALLLLLQRLSVLTERHDHLASLNRLGERISLGGESDAVMAETLNCALELLAAREASARLLSSSDGLPVAEWRRDEHGLQHVDGLETQDSTPGMTRTRLVVSAPVATTYQLVLTATGRARSARAFRQEDRRVLEMIARQTAAHLHTAELIEQLRHDALHDSFSDLPNRRALIGLLEARMADHLPTEVVVIGVRNIRTVNEALGHDHGDELVRQVGSRLLQVAGAGASVGRIGDDAFVVLLPLRMDGTGGGGMVAALLAGLGRPFTLGPVEAVLAASAGVAVDLGVGGAGANDLLRRAEIAHRHAERTGQPVEQYRADLETATPARLALAADLQAGLTRDELRLFGQPQTALDDGAVIGIEALVRWQHPELGLLGPDTFMPLAVQTGLDRAVTAWVVNAAVKTLAAWRAEGLDVSVSVNVSAPALADRHFPEMVEEMLALRDVPGTRLIVELTESDLLASPAAAAENLHRLSERGVGVSVDDFGTGFSSLSHLRRLPVDEIKIDRSFVLAMLEDLDDAAIVRSVIQLSRELGLRCVAEGVENEGIQSALQSLGCDVAQGFHIARPMPMADVAGWVRAAQACVAF